MLILTEHLLRSADINFLRFVTDWCKAHGVY